MSLACISCSSPRHPHYGSGHHSQRSLQLPQQVPAHHHDVKQREPSSHRHAGVTGAAALLTLPFLSCFLQFVEIKGSVFKKFEKNNLFQMSNSGE